MNILFTSAGRRTYLLKYFKEALAGNGEIHAMNSSSLTPIVKVADKFTESPLIYDPSYIDFVLDYCKENKIDAVISLFDIDLPVLAQNKKRFEEAGVKLIVSDYEAVAKCNDKLMTYITFCETEVKVPKTYVTLKNVIRDLREGKMNYPVIVKPRWGMGSIAVYEATCEQELRAFYKKTLREIQKSYLKYESFAEKGYEILIQEKIEGQEYGLDIINDLNGKYVTTIVKKKFAMRAGETDAAEIVEYERLSNLGKRISGLVGHVANLDVDIIVQDGVPYIIEMNARFGGGYPFSHAAGVNLPLAIIKWIKGEEAPKELFTAEIGTIAHKDINITIL